MTHAKAAGALPANLSTILERQLLAKRDAATICDVSCADPALRQYWFVPVGITGGVGLPPAGKGNETD